MHARYSKLLGKDDLSQEAFATICRNRDAEWADARCEVAACIPDKTPIAIFGRDIDTTQPLGSGTDGQIYKVNREADTVVKMNPYEATKKLKGDSGVISEIAIMKMLRNEPGIAKAEQFGFAHDANGIECFCFSMNRYNGDLYEFISSDTPTYQYQVKCFARQLLGALDHCHSMGVIHLDIKPGNILWDKTRDKVMLSDFGRSALIDLPTMTLPKGSIESVTWYYRPPELLSNTFSVPFKWDTIELSPKIDMWSMACVFTDMMLKEKAHIFPYNFINDQWLLMQQDCVRLTFDQMLGVDHSTHTDPVGVWYNQMIHTTVPKWEKYCVDNIDKIAKIIDDLHPHDQYKIDVAYGEVTKWGNLLKSVHQIMAILQSPQNNLFTRVTVCCDKIVTDWPEMASIVQWMMQQDPNMRPSANDVMKTQYFEEDY